MKTNFMAYILTPIASVTSLYWGIHFDPHQWRRTLLQIIILSVATTLLENLGNRLIHGRLAKGRREEKARMIAEYANIIDKAKPRNPKKRHSKRKKR